MLCSCEKDSDTTFEYTKSLVNETDKILFYAVSTSKGSNSDFSYGHDSIGFYFVHYGKVTLPFVGPYHIDIEGIGMREEKLYNLTDTSSFQFNLNRNTWSKEDSLYWAHIIYNVFDGSNKGIHEIHFETLRLKDTLLAIMQKDYSMLEKFKEYYAHE
jgi:hypothetical protein